jgi:hypothetical protein
MHATNFRLSILALAVLPFLASCGQTESTPAKSSAPQPSSASTSTPAAKSRKGINEKGEVIDPKIVEAGSGKQVHGLNGYDGEIVGIPVPGSKFDKLQIGMNMHQVYDILGAPTDQGAYVTGKAWIPFYYGSDTHRYEMIYKGKGRLVFAGGSLYGYSGGGLIWIINSSHETGYR